MEKKWSLSSPKYWQLCSVMGLKNCSSLINLVCLHEAKGNKHQMHYQKNKNKNKNNTNKTCQERFSQKKKKLDCGCLKF